MHPKIEKWLSNEVFPQRILLSGKGDLVTEAIMLAGQLQGVSTSKIEAGICSDVSVFRDMGESFKIGDRQNPAKDSIRGLIKWTVQKPLLKHRIVILENFERLSRDAPHAILKVLEEPPEKAIFIFTTQNHHRIMETILSRMTVVRMPSNFKDFEISDEVKQFFQSPNLIWKFKKIEDLIQQSKKEKDKSIITDFVEDCIIHARFFETYQKHLEKLLEAQTMLAQNINSRLCLEHLVMNIKRDIGTS